MRLSSRSTLRSFSSRVWSLVLAVSVSGTAALVSPDVAAAYEEEDPTPEQLYD